jgi:hypothetical protein
VKFLGTFAGGIRAALALLGGSANNDEAKKVEVRRPRIRYGGNAVRQLRKALIENGMPHLRSGRQWKKYRKMIQRKTGIPITTLANLA